MSESTRFDCDLSTIEHRACYLNFKANRPCSTCKKTDFSLLKFHDSLYQFWAVDYESATDGAIQTIICRTRQGQTVQDRLDRLTGEIEREVVADEKRIKETVKHGEAWQVLEMADLGRDCSRYASMLRGAKIGVPRHACACEVAVWANGHKNDMIGCKTDLNKLWTGLIRDP